MPRLDTIRSSCRYVDGKRLYAGTASLSAYAIRVRGWVGVRSYSRRIPLDDVQSVSRRSEIVNANLSLELMTGDSVAIHVSAPGLWRIEVAQRIRELHPERTGDGDRAELLGRKRQASEDEPGPEIMMRSGSLPRRMEPPVGLRDKIAAEVAATEPVTGSVSDRIRQALGSVAAPDEEVSEPVSEPEVDEASIPEAEPASAPHDQTIDLGSDVPRAKLAPIGEIETTSTESDVSAAEPGRGTETGSAGDVSPWHVWGRFPDRPRASRRAVRDISSRTWASPPELLPSETPPDTESEANALYTVFDAYTASVEAQIEAEDELVDKNAEASGPVISDESTGRENRRLAPDVVNIVTDWMARAGSRSAAGSTAEPLSVKPPSVARSKRTGARRTPPEWRQIRFIGAEGRGQEGWLPIDELATEERPPVG